MARFITLPLIPSLPALPVDLPILPTSVVPASAGDPDGLLSGLLRLDLLGLDLNLLGNTLGGTALALDGTSVTLPTGLNLGGILGTETADTVMLSDDSVLGSAVFGAGNDTLLGPVGAVVNGIIDGGDGNDVLTIGTGNGDLRGGNGDDRLTAGSGDNTLDGGAGGDTMAGGMGDDIYIVDNVRDDVTEARDAGTDAVHASISYTLGANVENLLLTGTAALQGSGNELANALTGNSGNNLLNGGAGVDVMRGGAGDDTYVVDVTADKVYESANSGYDTIQSAQVYRLGTDVEKLVLTGGNATNATGNTLANSLVGNSGANVLDGGAGVDVMTGGEGNDTYIVDDRADKIYEVGDGGYDTIRSSATYRMGSGVEKLVLTGTASIDATGNDVADTIVGNDGSNVIIGGAGADVMTGGKGADTFRFDDGDFGGNTGTTGDRILDFNHAEGDRIDLKAADAELGGTDQSFVFIGTGAFSGEAGELRTYISPGNTYVQGDLDGNGVADFMIRLDGRHELLATDFVF